MAVCTLDGRCGRLVPVQVVAHDAGEASLRDSVAIGDKAVICPRPRWPMAGV